MTSVTLFGNRLDISVTGTGGVDCTAVLLVSAVGLGVDSFLGCASLVVEDGVDVGVDLDTDGAFSKLYRTTNNVYTPVQYYSRGDTRSH